MQQLARALISRLGPEEGQGMAEYALIIALVALAVVPALGLFSGGLDGLNQGITGAFNAVADLIR